VCGVCEWCVYRVYDDVCGMYDACGMYGMYDVYDVCGMYDVYALYAMCIPSQSDVVIAMWVIVCALSICYTNTLSLSAILIHSLYLLY